MEGFGDIKPIWQHQKWEWSTFLEAVEKEGSSRPVTADAQVQRIRRSLDQYGRARGLRLAPLRRALQRRTKLDLHIINPSCQNTWLTALARAFERVQPALGNLVKITGLDLNWHVDLATAAKWGWLDADWHVAKIQRLLHRRFRGWNYVLTIEFAIHEVGKTRLLCFHAEGLVWGKDLNLQAAKGMFPGGLHDSYGLDDEEVTYLPGVLRYMTKIDLRVHRFREQTFKNSHHDTRKITNKELFDVAYACRSLRWPEVTAAGKEGRKIVRAALDHAGWT